VGEFPTALALKKKGGVCTDEKRYLQSKAREPQAKLLDRKPIMA